MRLSDFEKKVISSLALVIGFTALLFCKPVDKRYNLSGKEVVYENPHPELRQKAKECKCSFIFYPDFDYGRFYYECDYYEYDEGEARDICRHIITEDFLENLGYKHFRIKPIPLRHPTKNPETGKAVQRWEAVIEFLQ